MNRRNFLSGFGLLGLTSCEDMSLFQSLLGANQAAFTAPYYYKFDGTNEYLNFVDALDSVLAGTACTFTISFNILLANTTAAANKMLITKWTGSGNQRQFQIFIDTDRKLNFQTSSNGTATAGLHVVTTPVYTNLVDWYTIDIVFDGSQTGSTNVMSIYVNGVEQAITSLLNTSKTIVNSTAPIRAACNFSGANVAALFYDGYLNQINIWDRVLTGSEILAKYNSGRPLNPTTYTNLIGSWLFSADTFSTNWTVVDTSGNGNNGSSVNMEEADRGTS